MTASDQPSRPASGWHKGLPPSLISIPEIYSEASFNVFGLHQQLGIP